MSADSTELSNYVVEEYTSKGWLGLTEANNTIH